MSELLERYFRKLSQEGVNAPSYRLSKLKNSLGADSLNTNLWIYPNHVTTGEVVETIVNTSGEQWADEDGTLDDLYCCDSLVTDLLYNMFA